MAKEKSIGIIEKTEKMVPLKEFEAFKQAVIADLNELARNPQTLNVNQGE